MRTAIVTLLLWCRLAPAADVTLSPGKPADVGMNESMLQAAVDLYREAIARDEARGAVLLVARKGRVVLHEALGWRDREAKDPMKKDAMFRMASNTKPVVATGIAILAERGRLRFKDSVSLHLDSFDHDRARRISLHHLLTHTSGFRIKPIFYRPLLAKSAEHPNAPNLRLEVDRFGQTGPTEPVGKSYSYSNAGYNTLGAVAEVVSGKPLDVFLHDAIYTPLGMTDSYHHEVADKLEGKLNRMSAVYYRRKGEWTTGWKPGQAPLYPFVRASGGMISTAMDYAVFCQMYLNGGIYDGQRLLKEETIGQLVSPHTKTLYASEQKAYYGYGYGWRVHPDGVFAHAGSDGTAAWVDPAKDLIVLAFTQSPNGSRLRDQFFQTVRLATQEFPPVSKLPSESGLPDPFRRPDGSRVKTPAEWDAQRLWLKQLLAHYMYGRMPPRPAPQQVDIKLVETRAFFDGAVEERYQLTIRRNDRSAKLRFALIRPDAKKRFPTIIKNCRALFDAATAGKKYEPTVKRDLAAAREAVKRGYLLCKFRREDFAPDHRNNRDAGIFPLYPEARYDWGSIAVWAWTHQVVLDALDQLGYADLDRIVATGHSRGGQTAIAAGIYDERIDLVAPCTGGYGACATLRIRDPKGVRGTMDYIAHLKKHVPHWFNQRYLEFIGRQNKLPFDSHTLVALIAPRPLLNTNATEDEYNNTLAVEAGMRAGSIVYDWLDRGGWARLHWRPGRHAQREEDWTALLDFADEAFFDKRGTSRFDQWQFPKYRPALNWSEPSQ